MHFTITDEDLKDTLISGPTADSALYFVVFQRYNDDEEDYISGQYDHAGAIKQLSDEIQEAGFDQGGMPGNFQIVGRQVGEIVRHTKDVEFDKDAPRSVRVICPDTDEYGNANGTFLVAVQREDGVLMAVPSLVNLSIEEAGNAVENAKIVLRKGEPVEVPND